MDTALLLSQVFTGLVTGLTLVLLALGLSLIFGLMGVVNFAHGSFYALGAYVGLVLFQQTGSFWPALFVAPLILAAVGFAVERGLLRWLEGRSEYEPLLLTFGLTYVISEGLKLVFGRIGKPFDIPDQFRGVVDLSFVLFPKFQIFSGVVCLASVVLLWLFLERTDIGRIVRAGTQDRTMVQILGINLSRVQVMVFALGIGLAGLAGILSAPLKGVHPDMGQDILVFAFVVVVVGGLGSFWGSVVSGILIGLVISITTLYRPEWSQIIVFILMALVLLVRPRGLLGTA